MIISLNVSSDYSLFAFRVDYDPISQLSHSTWSPTYMYKSLQQLVGVIFHWQNHKLHQLKDLKLLFAFKMWPVLIFLLLFKSRWRLLCIFRNTIIYWTKHKCDICFLFFICVIVHLSFIFVIIKCDVCCIQIINNITMLMLVQYITMLFLSGHSEHTSSKC